MSNRNAVLNHLVGMLIWPIIGMCCILIIKPSSWAFMSLFTAIPTFGFIAIYSGQAAAHRDLISTLFILLWIAIFCIPLIYRWRFEDRAKTITYFAWCYSFANSVVGVAMAYWLSKQIMYYGFG